MELDGYRMDVVETYLEPLLRPEYEEAESTYELLVGDEPVAVTVDVADEIEFIYLELTPLNGTDFDAQTFHDATAGLRPVPDVSATVLNGGEARYSIGLRRDTFDALQNGAESR